MLLQQHPPACLVVELETAVFVIGPVDNQESPPAHAIELAIGHVVGGNKAAELDEQVGREGLIAADAFRLGDEVEQLLQVASRGCCHEPSKIRRFPNGLHRRPGEALVADEAASPASSEPAAAKGGER